MLFLYNITILKFTQHTLLWKYLEDVLTSKRVNKVYKRTATVYTLL